MLKPVVCAAFLALALTAVAIVGPLAAADTVISVPGDDPEMTAAIAKARASLPTFWKSWEAPQPGEEAFSLKVRIPYGSDNRAEHFWLNDIQRAGGKYSGIITNEPAYATHVSMGQRYEFQDAEISDWLFMRNGKMVGNETLRPLLKRLPKEQADQYRELLETP